MAGKGFRELTQGMSAKEKLEYLWEYYKWVLLVLAMVAMVAAMVITGIINKSVEILYSGVAVNVQLSEEGSRYLTQDLADELGAVGREKADLFVTSFQDLQTTSDAEVNAAAAMQVVLMITTADYDYVMMDQTAFDFYKNHSIFASLETIFPPEVLAQYDASFVYHETQEDGRYPIAIDITECSFARGCIAEGDRVFIAFPGNTGRTELNDDFLAYLMDWK